MLAPEPASRIREIVRDDRQDLVDLCLLLGNTPSPHAQELEVATVVVGWLRDNGIRAWLQPITDHSANAVGLVPGSGDGTSLILDAHLDTGPALPADAPDRLRRIHQAWVEDDTLYGFGVVNDKGQLAAAMIAARALVKAGVELAGDLVVAGVAFETGAPSVGDRQGIEYPGEGFGTWWLFNRGVTADYALIGETSAFGLVTAECGQLGLRVTLSGRRVYTPRLERGTSAADHPSSVVRMADAVVAMEEWAVRYERDAAVSFDGGTIVPKAQIVAVDSTPASSTVDLDVRLAPGANPRSVRRSLQRHLDGRGLACTVEAYQWSRGYVAEHADPLIGAVTDAHLEVFGSQPPQPPTPEVSMWRDLNMFNEVGIPSICYGPPRQPESFSDARDRAMKIDDLVAATEVYALTALGLCGAASPPA